MQKDRKRLSKEIMLPMIERWQQGPMSKAQYCRAENLNIHTFNYWLGKFKKQKASPSLDGFLPIKVQGVGLGQTFGSVEVHCGGGTTIILNGPVSAEYLGQLIRTLSPCLP